VHGGTGEGFSIRPEAREMLRRSLTLLQELSLQHRPVLLMMSPESKIVVGKRMIEQYLSAGLPPLTPEAIPQLCSPSGC